MKGDGRARVLMKLLEEIPCGTTIFKNDEPRTPELPHEPLGAEEEADFKEWQSNVDEQLGEDAHLSEEEFEKKWGVKLPDFERLDFERPTVGPTWSILWTDDYGDRGTIEVAEDTDLIKALLAAKNRLANLGVT